MKRVHKRTLAILWIILLCLISAFINKKEVYAEGDNKYLVLIQQKNGTWKEYENFMEISEDGYLMIKAKQIAKALGFTYNKGSDGTFVIKKSASCYNGYTKNSNEFVFTDGALNDKKKVASKAYTSKQSNYNLCQISSLNTLVNYKYFDGVAVKAYSSYKGVVCFSKYNDIPKSVPIVTLKPTQKPTPTPTQAPEPSSFLIEGVEFPIRTGFLKKDKAFSDWGGTAILWSELKQEVDGKIIKSTNLWYDSNKIEFSHLAAGSDGVSLTKADKGFRLSISVKLNGSVIAEQNASIVKAMVVTISSKPSLLYEAIYDSFTSNETHGINEKTYVTIGDCKLKVEVKDGIITYIIKER